MSAMLTNNPNIVIARPPRRIRKPKTAAQPAAVVVGRKVAPELPEEERDHAPSEAAERLWRELVRRVEERRRVATRQKSRPRGRLNPD